MEDLFCGERVLTGKSLVDSGVATLTKERLDKGESLVVGEHKIQLHIGGG